MTALLAALLIATVPVPPAPLPPDLAVAGTGAVRMTPPAAVAPPPIIEIPTFSSSSAGGRCVGAEALLAFVSPGWNVQTMSRIMYRESRCQPTARNTRSSATGLFQILASHCPWLSERLETWCTRDRLTDPYFNVAAAVELFEYDGYGPWSMS